MIYLLVFFNETFAHSKKWGDTPTQTPLKIVELSWTMAIFNQILIFDESEEMKKLS